MLVQLFRSNRPAVLLILLVLVPGLFGKSWAMSMGTHAPAMPLYAILHGALAHGPVLPWLVGVVLVGTIAVQATWFANEAGLVDQRTYLPALLFPLLIGALGRPGLLDPALMGMPLVLLAMRDVFAMGTGPGVLGRLFDAGALLGIATLFHLPYAFLVVVVLGTVSVTRPFAWREYVVPLLGIALVLFLCWSMLLFMGATWDPYRTVWQDPDTIHTAPRLQRIILYLVCGIGVVVAAYRYLAGYQRSVMRVRNLRAAFIGLMAAMGIMILLLHALNGQFPPVWLALPLSIFLSHALTGEHWRWLGETAVAILALTALWVQW